jgi:hypothetical protein
MAHRRHTAPTTPTASRAALPAERAFVVQLRADADLTRGAISGRIEHVVSGTAALFDSMEQLIGCMRDALARRSGPSPYGDDDSTP